MSRTAPGIASQTFSPCAHVGIQQLQALAATGRAFQARSKVFVHRAVCSAKPIRQSLHIKFRAVIARQTPCRDVLTTSQAITQCRVRAECTHDSLQGGTGYSKNETETNHKLRGEE